MYSIGLRYCGGCNPQIDRSRVTENLKEGLKEARTEVDFTTDTQRAVDIVLLINGCMHACLEEKYLGEAGSRHFISVKGEMVDSQYVKEDHIPEILTRKILDLLDSPSH
ncbi:MAG: hypothetical protein JRJ79_15895 [Deltaproteobacteria bacterium]|nr:hypothetical protein [Deltaproteobacteria bacterium]MBW2339421.1 hypothetical protein [Deltaproteobacteria bacterium]